MKYTITAAMLENLTVGQLLLELKADYGVALSVGVVWTAYGNNIHQGTIYVDFLMEEGRKEYHNMPEQTTIVLSTRVMELEKQIKFALMLWEAALDAHMR